MKVVYEITGLNIERLLKLAVQNGLTLRGVRRMDERTVQAGIDAGQRAAFEALCAQYGWSSCAVRRGWILRVIAFCRNRPTIPAAVVLWIAMVLLSSGMIWRIQIDHAGKNIGEIRTYLRELGIVQGRFKTTVSLGNLRDTLALRLPDLAYVGVKWKGSTLVIDCQPALTGDEVLNESEGLHLVALEDGIVTRIAVHSGTPAVKAGQAVRKGDVLIRGEERGEKGSLPPVKAQGEVLARVWASAEARIALTQRKTVETGAIRKRISLCTPWKSRVVRDAQPFASQDTSVELQPVVGLFVPVWREIETLAETVEIIGRRSYADAASMAQAAAQQEAKLKCPSGVEILDKTVDYSMIDNEYVCATVVLEYERDIAARRDTAESLP